MRLSSGRELVRVKPPAIWAGLRARGSSRRARIAAGLRDQLVADPQVETTGYGQAQQFTRVLVTEPFEDHVGQAREHGVGLPHGEHQGDALRVQTPGREGEGTRGRLVEPLCVVDDAQQCLLLGGLGQQPQQGQPHEERARRGRAAQAERHLDRFLLRSRQPGGGTHHVPAELLEAGVGKFHLGLGGDDALGADVCGGPCREVVQERGLADTGLTGDDQCTGAAASGTAHQRFQFRQLDVSSPQGRDVRHHVRLRREVPLRHVIRPRILSERRPDPPSVAVPCAVGIDRPSQRAGCHRREDMAQFLESKSDV